MHLSAVTLVAREAVRILTPVVVQAVAVLVAVEDLTAVLVAVAPVVAALVAAAPVVDLTTVMVAAQVMAMAMPLVLPMSSTPLIDCAPRFATALMAFSMA